MMIIVNARIYNVLLAGEGIHINAKILMSVFNQLIHVQVWDKIVFQGIIYLLVFIYLNLVCLFFKRQFDKLFGYTWIVYLRMYFTWLATKRSNSTKGRLSMCEC